MEMDFQGRAKNMAREDLNLLLLMVLTISQSRMTLYNDIRMISLRG